MLKSRLESLQKLEDHFITAHLSNIILSSIILRQWIKWFMNETTYDSFLHKPLKWNNNGKLEKSLKVNKTNILQICKHLRLSGAENIFHTMVFCYQNCSDVLWEKNVLVIEKFFWNSRLKADYWQTLWGHYYNLFKQLKARTIL